MTNYKKKLSTFDLETLLKQTRKSDANPGGGAILIIISNLALNLILMMDRKSWKEKKDQAEINKEEILKLSESLSLNAQDDVDNFAYLMEKIIEGQALEKDYYNASKPLLTMIDTNIKALEILKFYLEYGKISTITDGQIANDILKQTIISALPTIKLNLENFDEKIDLDKYINLANKLHKENTKIIERRKK
ncbi:cyclodeaminase/cyclohydrolase family protein [Anaerococcus sp. Marseille-P9784]|uniref:cyclodeaminase/cyclohydrolase family protein n=1 Tax=Anaerococcus sp. Marseille-P9784 TaxID=2614127 RepID=UPI001249EB48|nr:cyclodeaminase/cyclohydrolase family protein [Anaerococcus sp. Marseille-P9784]